MCCLGSIKWIYHVLWKGELKHFSQFSFLPAQENSQHKRIFKLNCVLMRSKIKTEVDEFGIKSRFDTDTNKISIFCLFTRFPGGGFISKGKGCFQRRHWDFFWGDASATKRRPPQGFVGRVTKFINLKWITALGNETILKCFNFFWP